MDCEKKSTDCGNGSRWNDEDVYGGFDAPAALSNAICLAFATSSSTSCSMASTMSLASPGVKRMRSAMPNNNPANLYLNDHHHRK